MPYEHRRAGADLGDAQLLLHSIERRDAAARALPAEQPGITALGVDAFEECELDQLIRPRLVGGHLREPLPQRELVSRGTQVHPGFPQPTRVEKQLADLAARGKIR